MPSLTALCLIIYLCSLSLQPYASSFTYTLIYLLNPMLELNTCSCLLIVLSRSGKTSQNIRISVKNPVNMMYHDMQVLSSK